MCNFFSALVTRDGSILFTEEDSHEEAIARSGLKDDLNYFVRVEYNEETGYKIDEWAIPEWYERNAAKAEANTKAIFAEVAPFHEEYEKIKRSAWAECKKIAQSAWVEYIKIERSAWLEGKKIVEHALAEYKKIAQPAWVEYKKIVHLARVDYALHLENIDGYVGKKFKNENAI